MNTPSRRRGRSSFLVEPYRQVKLGLMFVAVNLLFSVLIFGIFGYYVIDIYQSVAQYFQLGNQEALVTFAKFRLPLVVGAVIIAIFIVTTLYVAARYTHGIYGPMVSIRRFLDELLAGKQPGRIAIRESDQLKDLTERLNQLTSTYAFRVGDRPMQSIIHFLDELIVGKNPEPLRLRDSDELKKIADRLNKLSEKFQGQNQTDKVV